MQTKRKYLLNYNIHYIRVTILILNLLGLLSSSLYLMPFAYPQKFSYVPSWSEQGFMKGKLSSPEGIALDQEGNVYVADTENSRIQVFSNNGTFISTIGKYGTRNGTLTFPEGIALDQEGNVYVADTENSRIQVFSNNGTFISTIGKYGTRNGTLTFPEGIALDQEGNVYVADTENSRIQVFSNNGTFISTIGKYGTTNGTLRSPEGIALDQEGNVYVADTANNRISAFSRQSPITNIAFSGKEGEIYGNDKTIKIETIYQRLGFPTAIAFLGPNDMVVLQLQNNSIMRIVNGQMLDEPVLSQLENHVRFLPGSCVCDIAILQNDNGPSYAFVYSFRLEVTED